MEPFWHFWCWKVHEDKFWETLCNVKNGDLCIILTQPELLRSKPSQLYLSDYKFQTTSANTECMDHERNLKCMTWWLTQSLDSPAAGRCTVWLWHGMNPLSVSDTGKRLVWVMINFIQIICRYILYVQNYNPVYTCSHRNILGTQTKKIVVCWRKRLLLLEEMKRWRFRL